MLEISVVLFENVGLLAFLAVLYGLVPRQFPGIPHALFVGLLCGIGAMLTMLNPIHFANGFIIDSRATMILLSGLFGGPVSVLIAVVIAAATRLTLGGAGAIPGVAMILISGILGLLGYLLFRHKGKPATFRSLVLMAALSPFTSIGALLLPPAILEVYVGAVMLPISLAQIIGVLMLGLIMLQENERVAFEAEVKRQAVTDELSGLPNRRAFYARLAEEWQRQDRYKVPFCILLVDIDHFKSINDRYGHKVGDMVIAGIGRILNDSCRLSDLPARIGGEEFAVLMPHTEPEAARALADRIRQMIEKAPVRNGEQTVAVTVSLGVSSSDDFPVSIDELVSAADGALYESKRTGRNRVCVAGADWRAAAREADAQAADAQTAGDLAPGRMAGQA
ncbi:diguanylate cyclase [Amorphus suaedae]